MFHNTDLCDILGISIDGLDLYTTMKELEFDEFHNIGAVNNIYRPRDLSDDICALSFRSQLLSFQARIIHSILQHIMTRLDVGLSNSLI